MHTRFALLIGNNDYGDKPLNNPEADITRLTPVLNQCGFDVSMKPNQSALEMEILIKDFGSRLERGGELGILYFAGHGCELGNNIFLLPVDCPVSKEVSTLLNYAVSLTQIEEWVKDAKSALVLIMDACRDQLDTDGTFLPDGYKRQHKHQPPLNSIYVFSVASGNEASDGKDGSNSPFATSLLWAFKDYHHDVETLLKLAIEKCSSFTKNKQRPRIEGTLRSPIPLSPVERLNLKRKLTAYGVANLYGLAQHPIGAGVLGWSHKDKIYDIRLSASVLWMRIQSEEIMCLQTAANRVWIAFKNEGKTFLGQAQSLVEEPAESMSAIEIDLQEAHAISVDTQNHFVCVAGRDAKGGKCAVYFYKENRIEYIIPEQCEEIYIAKSINKDLVLLGGPNDYLAVYSFLNKICQNFTHFDSRRKRRANFYSLIIFPEQEFALAGGSEGGLHRLDLRTLIRHPPLILPTNWQENELFKALREVADNNSITQFIENKELLSQEAREFLEQKLPSNNVLTLLKNHSNQIVIACSDAGRIYSLSVRDMKILDFDIVSDGKATGQAVIDKNEDIFVDANNGEIKVYQLSKQ